MLGSDAAPMSGTDVMDALLDYFAMDGYWAYVWSAYGAAALVLVALLVSTLRTLRARESALAELDRQRPRRRSGRRGVPTRGDPHDA